ncbi:MAG: MBL fold metallo-hydrolase [Pyrinomonadaceae bacterium]|nr:MBL fold metallo-hydrolase [Pyrinomonadaceae bacterium]
MLIKTFTITPFQQNTRVVVCEDTGNAVCIDPGEKCEAIVDFITDNEYTFQAVTLTHGHLDHAGGTLDLHRAFPEAEILLHKDDEPLYYGLPQQPLRMGIPQGQLKALGFDYEAPPKITRNWEHGESYAIGNLTFEVLHCPGHTPGHVVFAEKKQRSVFVGDCLFQGSIGRTDLPGGSHEQLLESIKNNILSLGDDFTVYSGHGPETTVGHEKNTNPFLTGTYQIGRGRYI